MLPRRTCAFLLLLAACVAAQAQPLGAQRDSTVKAAFLYKFGGFVEWPAGVFVRPDDPMVIGVFGDDAVAADLEQLAAGRTVEGHPLAVRRIRESDALERLHVLFVGGTREARVREVLAAVRGPVLTVTDIEGGRRLGGVLNFTSDGGRVRFTASLTQAQARGLRLSARLLAVAQDVEGR